jgi:hypothetical protein
MSYVINNRFNKYPEDVKTKEEQAKYRDSLLFPCFNCKRLLPVWNREFISNMDTHTDGFHTVDNIWCAHCGVNNGYSIATTNA